MSFPESMSPSPSRLRLLLTWAPALLLFAIGCTSPETEPPIDPVGELLLGGSDLSGSEFVPLDDGDDVELVSGAQGGFHVWTSIRVTGAAGPLYLTREARRVSDGTLVLRAQRLYLDVPDTAMEDWWQRDTAAPSFMCPSPVGIKVFDTEIALSAELTDDDGNILAEQHLVFVPRCPDGDQADWCQNICSG